MRTLALYYKPARAGERTIHRFSFDKAGFDEVYGKRIGSFTHPTLRAIKDARIGAFLGQVSYWQTPDAMRRPILESENYEPLLGAPHARGTGMASHMELACLNFLRQRLGGNVQTRTTPEPSGPRIAQIARYGIKPGEFHTLDDWIERIEAFHRRRERTIRKRVPKIAFSPEIRAMAAARKAARQTA